MAVSNKELISKADLALSEITSTSGKLNPDQTNRFIRKLIDSPTILNSVRTVAMPGPEMKINKIGFAGRILMPAVSTTGLDDTTTYKKRSKPSFSQVALTTSEVIAEVRLPYEVLEDSIERASVAGSLQDAPGGLHGTIVDLIGERAALDLEELVVLGDTGHATDDYLKLQNGYLKLATLHSASVGSGFTKDTIKAAVKAMPYKYLRNRSAMVHFVPVDAETDLRDQYGNRQTAFGDSMVQGNSPVTVFGSQVKGAAMLASPAGLFTHPQNLIFGIQRNLMMEFDKDIRARQYIIVLTARVAVQIEEPDAVVKYVA